MRAEVVASLERRLGGARDRYSHEDEEGYLRHCGVVCGGIRRRTLGGMDDVAEVSRRVG